MFYSDTRYSIITNIYLHGDDRGDVPCQFAGQVPRGMRADHTERNSNVIIHVRYDRSFNLRSLYRCL